MNRKRLCCFFRFGVYTFNFYVFSLVDTFGFVSFRIRSMESCVNETCVTYFYIPHLPWHFSLFDILLFYLSPPPSVFLSIWFGFVYYFFSGCISKCICVLSCFSISFHTQLAVKITVRFLCSIEFRTEKNDPLWMSSINFESITQTRRCGYTKTPTHTHAHTYTNRYTTHTHPHILYRDSLTRICLCYVWKTPLQYCGSFSFPFTHSAPFVCSRCS